MILGVAAGEGGVEGAVFRHHEKLFAVSRCGLHGVKAVHVVVLLRRHEVDVGDVGVEAGIEALPAQKQSDQQYGPQQPHAALKGEAGKTADEGRVAFGAGHLHQMGKEQQREKDGAHQQQGAEETQIAQCRRLQRHQCEKSAYGGDVAHREWHEGFA